MHSARFAAMGVSTTVVVEEAKALPPALAAARGVVEAVDATCSRFAPASELSQLNDAAGSGPRHVSALLGAAIEAALAAAAATGGLVDPTMGRIIERLGYSVTFGELPVDGPALGVEVHGAPGWQTVEYEPRTQVVSLPAAVAIDVGAVGKAWAADRAAAAAAARVGAGVLVECGGDVAVAGRPPTGGWCVRVAERPGAPVWQDVLCGDGGIATSGTATRRWTRGGRAYHHILDPATGEPADSPWTVVTVAAATCAEANAAATAAVILGDGALAWLGARRLPARLVDRAGRVVTIAGWPEPGVEGCGS